MFNHSHRRHVLSTVLIALGAILIFLAPDNFWMGTALGIVGILIELIAFWFRDREEQDSN